MKRSEKTTDNQPAMLRVTLVRSTIGRPKDQGATVRVLGLRKLHQTVELPDNPSVRGMVNKVRHLVKIEDAGNDADA